MKSLRRTIPFLLLNIILSVAATLVVLSLWGSGLRLGPGQPAAATLSPNATALSKTLTQAESSPSPVLPAATAMPDANGRVIEIADVIGPGDINNEAVMLRRLGEGDLNLSGWKIDDNAGHKFIFPDFVLNKGGAVQVNTRTGANKAISLFWNLSEAIWSTGKMVTLFDPQGNLQASFSIK
jgi:hypothetical protein